MNIKSVSLCASFVLLQACTNTRTYRDTTDLEMPPRLEITQRALKEAESTDSSVAGTELDDSVLLEDQEYPPVIKIKKLFDRAWDMVGQALNKKKIEIVDKNRDKGVYFVKYDPSEDTTTGNVFGGVKFFFFEQSYEKSEYKLSLAWHETETQVRAAMLNKPRRQTVDEDEDGPVDGSEKLIQALYEAIRDEIKE